MAKLPVEKVWQAFHRTMFPPPDGSLAAGRRRHRPPELTFDDLPRPPPLDDEWEEEGLHWDDHNECFEYHEEGSTWTLAGQAGAPIDQGALVSMDERGLLVPADTRRTR
jgi:hypothetical protein